VLNSLCRLLYLGFHSGIFRKFRVIHPDVKQKNALQKVRNPPASMGY
jgi:hypothetical protein